MQLLHAASKKQVRVVIRIWRPMPGWCRRCGCRENTGSDELVAELVREAGAVGTNPAMNVSSLLAEMSAGADTIDGMDVLRHGVLSQAVAGSGPRRS